MTTRVIRITECSQCPHIDDMAHVDGLWVCFCGLMDSRRCPPTGTPAWCPLEAIKDAGGAR